MWGGVALGQHAPAPHGAAGAVVASPSTATAPADTQPALPPGHPGAGGKGAMPAGHPEVGDKNAPKTGALRVNFSQGTAGGSAIDKDPITVDLYAKGRILKTYPAKLDAKGLMELKDLPLDEPFQPVITVTHGDVPERFVGPAVTKFQHALEFEVKVYDVTDTKPAWTVGMRHIMMEPQGLGKVSSLKVVEMIGGFNPTDRAWRGTLNAAKKSEIFSVALPTGATDLVLGSGLLEAGATAENGRLTRPGPMLPGSVQYVFGYTVPVVDGKATLTFETPANTTLFAAYAPVGARMVKLEGVELAKPQAANGPAGIQLLKAHGVKAGTVVRVEMADIAFVSEPEVYASGATTQPGVKKP
jgi:hypothetical protein